MTRGHAAALLAAATALQATASPASARPRPRRSPAEARPPAATVDLGPAHLVVGDGWLVDGPSVGSNAGPGAGSNAGAGAGAEPGADAAPIVLRRGDAVMIVTRQPVGNLPAWSRATRAAHVDDLIAGFTADGAKVLARSLTTEAASQTPVLDLTLVRADRFIAVRVLLFRTLTAAAATSGDDRALLERAARGLHPDR